MEGEEKEWTHEKAVLWFYAALAVCHQEPRNPGFSTGLAQRIASRWAYLHHPREVCDIVDVLIEVEVTTAGLQAEGWTRVCLCHTLRHLPHNSLAYRLQHV